MPKTVTVLGSTGSIGCSTIDLLKRNPQAFKVVALAASRNVGLLAAQARELKPELVAVADDTAYSELKAALAGEKMEIACGEAGVIEAARRNASWVMASIVGAAGLKPTLAAIERGATIGLANKECLVCAGDLMMKEVARHKSVLLPVDSEHSAIFQVLDFKQLDKVEKIILTASGGPFREWSKEKMGKVTPEQAVAHPNWSMGAKISVDSASMMNKGLELIEAHHLFQKPSEGLDVLVHPQSVIHSMVSYVDGSVLAQLGTPDMRTPIAYALGYPERMAAPVARLDLAKIAQLTFNAPDYSRFPALKLAREALREGGALPTILNAANEVAVAAFLGREIGFLSIPALVEKTMEKIGNHGIETLDQVFAADKRARQVANEIKGQFA